MKKLLISLTGLAILGASFANADGFGKDREAAKQVKKAETLMSQALPIYNGKRAEADELCHRARKDIIEAARPGGFGERFAKLGDNDDIRRYNPRDIGESQRKMREALKHEEKALGALKRSDGTYDETYAAVRDLRKATELTRRCLEEYRR